MNDKLILGESAK